MQFGQDHSEGGVAGSRRFSPFSRFRRDIRGATAVEFALVALPFFGIILAILELGLIMLQSQLLETGVERAARKIYTGEFQTMPGNAGADAAKLQGLVKQEICEQALNLVPCAGTDQVAVDIRPMTSFTDVPPDPVVNKVYDAKTVYGYKDVGPNTIGLVTASFEYKTIFPPLAGAKLANGNRVITAAFAFRSEPYTK